MGYKNNTSGCSNQMGYNNNTSGCLCLISFGLSDEFSHSQGPNKVYFGKKRMIPKNWYRGLALAYYMIEEEYIVLIWDVQIK